MALPSEALMALVTAVLVAGPAAVLWRAWSRARGRRLLLAALGFTAFLLTDLVLAVGNGVGNEGIEAGSELIELVGDVVTAALFAAAFLLPSGGPVLDG